MLDKSVRYYDSTQFGAPAISGLGGSLISVLDACLVGGYGQVNVDSIVMTGGIATATCSTGHNFSAHPVPPVIKIEGATHVELNDAWRIDSIPSNTIFTFETTGVPDCTEAGGLIATRAPANWSKIFYASGKGAYRPTLLDSTACALRVDDTGGAAANYARVTGYEVMTDIDTGTGIYPTAAQVSGGLYWAKSDSINATARLWRLVASNSAFYLFVQPGTTAGQFMSYFYGDFPTYRAGDSYCSAIVGTSTASANGSSGCLIAVNATNSGAYIARSHTQLFTAVQAAFYTHGIVQGGRLGSGIAYPSPADSALLVAPVEIFETNQVQRGLLPGFLGALHSSTSLPVDGLAVPITIGLPGRTGFVQRLGAFGACVIDVTGPWGLYA